MADKPKTGLRTLSVHERRFFMLKGGKTADEIAAIDNVSVETVNRSVSMVQGEREMLTLEELHMGQISVVNNLQKLEEQAIAGMLSAEIETKDADGNSVTVPDHETRGRGVKLITSKVNTLTPKKGGGIMIGISNGGGRGPGGSPSGSAPVGARRFEDILREIDDKRRANMALTSGDPATSDAEFVDIPVYEGEAVITESAGGPASTA